MFKGESVHVVALNGGFVELCFDRCGETVNKFDQRTVRELKQTIAVIAGASNVRGVLITSAKQAFIVGADLNGFGELFGKPPGLGFPAYLGGALKYADWLGLGAVMELSDRYADLGPQYIATPTLRAMVRRGETFYGRN